MVIGDSCKSVDIFSHHLFFILARLSDWLARDYNQMVNCLSDVTTTREVEVRLQSPSRVYLNI